MQTILIPLLIGCLGGTIAALCGVGGGIVMVPAFVFLLGLEQKQAVATSLAVIAPTAIVAIARISAGPRSLVQWKLFIPTAIGACLIAFFAADWMKSFSNQSLTRIFAGVLIVVGFYMLFQKPR